MIVLAAVLAPAVALGVLRNAAIPAVEVSSLVVVTGTGACLLVAARIRRALTLPAGPVQFDDAATHLITQATAATPDGIVRIIATVPDRTGTEGTIDAFAHLPAAAVLRLAVIQPDEPEPHTTLTVTGHTHAQPPVQRPLVGPMCGNVITEPPPG